MHTFGAEMHPRLLHSLIYIPRCNPLTSLGTHLRVPVCLSLAVLIRDNDMLPDGRLVITALLPRCPRSAGGRWYYNGRGDERKERMGTCRGCTEEEKFRNKGRNRESNWRKCADGKWMRVEWRKRSVVLKKPLGERGVEGCHQHDWRHSLICNAN